MRARAWDQEGRSWAEQVEEEERGERGERGGRGVREGRRRGGHEVYDEDTGAYRSTQDPEWHEELNVHRNSSRHRINFQHGFIQHIVRSSAGE